MKFSIYFKLKCKFGWMCEWHCHCIHTAAIEALQMKRVNDNEMNEEWAASTEFNRFDNRQHRHTLARNSIHEYWQKRNLFYFFFGFWCNGDRATEGWSATTRGAAKIHNDGSFNWFRCVWWRVSPLQLHRIVLCLGWWCEWWRFVSRFLSVSHDVVMLLDDALMLLRLWWCAILFAIS